MLTVTTPASDRSLLTVAELRGAAGVGDTTQDAVLQTLGDRVSAMFAAYCGIPTDGIAPQTFRKEIVRESLRLGCPVAKLILQRLPIVQILAITEGGITLASTEYEYGARSGLLFRLKNDKACHWEGRITVSYEAGYTVVPDDLKMAAAKMVKFITQTENRDPFLKRETVPGVLEQEFWVGNIGGSSIPLEVSDLLNPYRYRIM
jgi:hypothetical protein